ncbi:hypothetical protein BD626DRAFT_397214 [Schizophyllum amplum]|uniref:Uncharacterized protein n=1 Tax=Schizophyllum amplum TaxID=97359 RepID=A0A550CQ51_9AGAR|nr:hypothetical protein BD626DRAFT_397214 [Auriculariopsis ampla]
MQRPSYLAQEDPLDALCHHYNVRRVRHTDTSTPTTLDMPVLSDSNLPTHVFAISQQDSASSSHIIVPFDITMYEKGFRVGINSPSDPDATPPKTHKTEDSNEVITLPVVPLAVPHAASIPLLLLFGLGLETQPNTLASRLLPPHVIEEFPNAAAMAQVLSQLGDDLFNRVVRYNKGIWANVLALGLRDTQIMGLVQTAWNVTAEARRTKQQWPGR